MWGKTELKNGQIGKITVLKPINLWERDANNQLKFERVLNPGEEYRVYRYDQLHGGQYGLGGGMYITKMPTHIKYETPSKSKLAQLEYETENAPLFGTYKGTYKANQGITGVTLVLEGTTGKFYFYAVEENPNVPSGVFTTTNTYNPKTGLMEIKGAEWVIKPSNYVTVDFAGEYKNGKYNGYVDSNTPFSFNLTRIK